MKIHRLWVDDKGESHFEDVEVEFTEADGAGRLSARLPATGIIFREVPPDYDLDWHPAPRRQYIINLDAGVQITASDGEARRIGAGEVILVEDTWGKGHLSKAVRRQDAPLHLRARSTDGATRPWAGSTARWCVVTGASRGIGAEIARLFAAEGGRVVCAARTLREGDHPLAGSLETTVAEIRAAGGEAQAVTVEHRRPGASASG